MSISCRSNKSVLLFNPWIYDFAAYDFWFKPLGLLSIGAVLRQLDYHVELIDCLDRYHPALQLDNDSYSTNRPDETGKFRREQIAKPAVLDHVPRKYCRYGMPPKIVSSLLAEMESPDVVLITSFMTYWYPAVVDAVAMVRQYFPTATIVLGGIYASLVPEHARAHSKPDYVITGEGESATAGLVAEITGCAGSDVNISTLDDLPMPALDLYPDLHSAAIMTSRGCPFSCSFCASNIVAPNYRRRSPENVVKEIGHWHENYNVHQFAFFDDALLIRSEDFIKPILRSVIQNGWDVNFHTPNGLTPRYFDMELAELFLTSGVRTVRLSFETVNKKRQQEMSAKVSCEQLEKALRNLEFAGYNPADIGVYVMMGLPDQQVDEVIDSIDFVHDLGAGVNLASFSPIPGTPEWKKSIDAGLWREDADLLLTNTSIFPLWSQTIGAELAQEISNYVTELNQHLKRPRN